MSTEEDARKKKERKEKLKAEAEKLGISYKELKEQKKEAKAKKKRSREAEALDSSEHKSDMKRMRAWSGEGKDLEKPTSSTTTAPKKDADEPSAKRRRTRSMDAKEEEDAKISTKDNMTPAEWRKDNHLTIKGHGKYTGQDASSFPDPYIKFTDAPFSQAILRSFETAGFKAPTVIQSQVCATCNIFCFYILS